MSAHDTFTVGDVVGYQLAGSKRSQATMIGRMAYGDDVLCLADENAHGMPIHESHCWRTGSTDPDALRYRARYESKYPGHLNLLFDQLYNADNATAKKMIESWMEWNK